VLGEHLVDHRVDLSCAGHVRRLDRATLQPGF
jgi:hypothetical protein